MATLGPNRHGKKDVRILRKHVEDGVFSVVEISADVFLEGMFDRAYLGDNNSQIVATDTIRNTILVLAHRHLGSGLEDFATTLAAYFLEHHPQVDRVLVELRERRWERMTPAGRPSPYSFHASGLGTPYTKLEASRIGREMESGIRGLVLLNATQSSFTGFERTEFTTLRDAPDRILSTEVEAAWGYPADATDFRATNERILAAMLEVFATRFSPSLQRTLFEMGEAALAVAPGISQITLRMPNKHYLPASLAAFGEENPGLTFIPQDEPHGQIEAVVLR